ncbi:bifunctional glutamate N-acetyltransferase/amino-acid acetyltransferase ArgJ [Chloroflexota bacterium]
MEGKFEVVPSGGVTSPRGFYAGTACAGIKESTGGNPDIGILFSETVCTAAALFTTNRIKAPPLILSRERIQDGRAAAVVVNSGCANAFTGEQGMADVEEMAGLAAESIGASSEDVLVASTGVIGRQLPMERVRAGMSKIVLSRDGGHKMARVIMTTDTVPKEMAVSIGGGQFVIGGIAKGSGMIHPDLATMLCFLTTDASVEVSFLKYALRSAADISFNMLSIDGDTSTNDMMLVMANGLAGNETITEGSLQSDIFQQALNYVCVHLAKELARDGEGASKLIEVTVSGARSMSGARVAARTIVSSPLVKAAIYGNDPNWGRIVAAAGRSGLEIVEAKIDLYIGDICLVQAGHPQPMDNSAITRVLKESEVSIALNLNLGSAEATAWGCDLTEEYVTINSQYTT